MSSLFALRHHLSCPGSRAALVVPTLLIAWIAGTAHAQCTSVFSAATSTAAGAGARSIAVADFNGDGIADMAVANSSANSISILRGSGNGAFTAVQTLTPGSGPFQVIAGDINNDGRIDLISANSVLNTCSLFLGAPDGTLGSPSTLAVGNFPRGVALGDLNGDGRLDLIVANTSSNTISVRTGNGNGTFNPQVTYPTGTNPNAVVLGDINEDGFLDVLVTRGGTLGITIFPGNGTGTFAATAGIAGVGGGGSLLIDINNDGNLDVLTLNQGLDQVFIVLGNGNGTFQSPTTLAVADVFAGWFPTAADFNGDGNIDLAVPSSSLNQIGIYFGDGVGGFGAGPVLTTGAAPYAAATGDFNGDGRPDVAAANFAAGTVSSFLNFSAAPSFLTQPVGGTFPADSDLTLTTTLNTSVPPATLQWHLNGTPLTNGPHYSGVDSPILSITALGRLEAGTYTCIATGCSTVTSNPAVITIQPPPCPADFNADGFVDFTDFDEFVTEFEAGC